MEIVLKNTSWHKNNMIYVIKQEGLYQNKVNSSLIFSRNCKMDHWKTIRKLINTFCQLIVQYYGKNPQLRTSIFPS